MELLEQARALDGELRAFKDQLHRHPELSFQEVHTTALLKEKLAGVNSVNAAKGKGARVDTVRQITFNAPVFVQATGASEPALSGAVAATKQNSFCPDVIKGNAGAYMFQVTSRSTRQGAKFDAKTVEQRLRQMALQAASRYMDELYLSAGVVDNRYLFF